MTISWIQASCLLFRQLVFNAWYGWFQYRELYTRSSLDRWVDLRFNSWRCDNRYYGRGCPSSRLYRLGNTWWNRICRRRAISYIGVPLAILFVHANNITDEAGIAAAAAPIGAAVGTIGTVLSTVPLL